jgi:hypothetical protein
VKGLSNFPDSFTILRRLKFIADHRQNASLEIERQFAVCRFTFADCRLPSSQGRISERFYIENN